MTLAHAILFVVLSQPAGVRVCAPSECEAHAHEFAALCESVGRQAGVDPWLLCAVAGRESDFDWDRTNAAGDFGAFQLNPRERWGKRARTWCELQPEQCHLAQTVEAAHLLRFERGRCGSWRGALAAYHRGKSCTDARGLEYAARVMRVRRELRGRV